MCRALFYVNTDFARTPSPELSEEVFENAEVSADERQFPNPYSGLESSTVIELDEEDDIAPRAETPVKRVRTRGGKRNIANKPGLCYLKNVPKKKRETAIATLGERPQIGAVDNYFKQEGIRPRGTQIRFVGQGSHVIRRRDWPTSLQWSIVTTHDRARQIGAEDWEHTEMWDEVLETALGDLLSPLDHFNVVEDTIEFEEVEEGEWLEEEIDADVMFGAPGDCWKKLLDPFACLDRPAGDQPITCRDLKKWMLSIAAFETPELFIRVERQSATMFHIHDVRGLYDFNYDKKLYIPMTRFLRTLKKVETVVKVVKRVYVTRKVRVGKIVKPVVNQFLSADELEEALLAGPGVDDVYFGRPAAPSLDDAMRQFYSPEIRGATERLVQPLIRDGVEEVSAICPYQIPVKNQHMMEELAIPWSKFNVIPHPHPIHAAIRRHTYKRELPKFIKSDCTFLGMKPEHFAMVKSAVDSLYGVDHFKLTLVNPIVDFKDIGRYAGTSTVPDGVWHLPRITTPMVFCDESGHYLSPEFMIKMKEDNPEVVCIGMSNIFPLLATEFNQSPNPDFADWRVQQGKNGPVLIYIPEGDEGGKYEQPFDPTMTLISSVTDAYGKVTWNGGVVFKKGHLRLQMFYSYHVARPEYIVEREYAMMPLPRVFRGQPATCPIRVDHYVKMFQYAKVLPNDKPENQWGKMRQFMTDEHVYFPVGDQAWLIKVVLHAAKIVATADLQSKSYDSVKGELFYKTIGHLIRFSDKTWKTRYADRNRALVNHRDPVYVFPAINAIVHDCKTGRGYGISWEVGADPGANFWHKFCNWIDSWAVKLGSKAMDMSPKIEGGLLRFPFLANTNWNRRVWGVEFVQASQTKHFLEVYENRVKDIAKPNGIVVETHLMDYKDPKRPKLLDRRLPPQDWHVLRPLLGSLESLPEEEEPGEESSLYTNTPFADSDEESSIASSEDLSSGNSTVVDSEADVTDGKPKLFDSPELKVLNVRRHCSTCLSYEAYVAMGLERSATAYNDYCETRHAYNRISPENAQMRKTMLGILDRRVFTNPSLKGPAIGTGNARNPQSKKLDDEEIRAMREARAKQDEQHQLVKPAYLTSTVVTVPQHVPLNYEERKADFEKLYAKRPSINFFVGKAIQSTLWNNRYPTTTSHRLAEVPYQEVVEFPIVEYPAEDCLLVALAQGLGKTTSEVFFQMLSFFPRSELHAHNFLAHKAIWPVALHYGVRVDVVDDHGLITESYGVRDPNHKVLLKWDGTHIVCISKPPGLAIVKPLTPPRLGTASQQRLIQNLGKWPALHWVEWKPERDRAAEYARALEAGTTGLLSQPINMDQLKEWSASTDVPATTKKFMAVIAGQPGCRKSSRLKRELKPFRVLGDFTVIEPTNALAQMWRDGLDALRVVNGRKMPGMMVTTFEKALAKYAGANLIVTDENRFPKGYMALFHILNPECRFHIFLGDPWQSTWHEPNSDCLLNRTDLLGELEYYMKYCKYYLVGTWRPTAAANFFGIPTFSRKWTSMHFSNVMPITAEDIFQYFPNVAPDVIIRLWEERGEFYAAHVGTVWADQLRGGDNNTYAGSVGLEFPFAIIEVDEAVLRMADHRLIYTAMTRSQHILFVYKWRNNGRSEAYEEANAVFRELRHYRERYEPGKPVEWDQKHMVNIFSVTQPMPPSMAMVLSGPPTKLQNWEHVKHFYPEDLLEHFIDPDDNQRSGARLRYDEEAYQDRPDFWLHIDETEEFDEEEWQPYDFKPADYRLPTHLPAEKREMFEEDQNAQILERYEAELFEKEFSEQLPDTPQLRKDATTLMTRMADEMIGANRKERWAALFSMLRSKPLDENPLYVSPSTKNWGLDQKASDRASFLAAVKQRIRFSTVEGNYAQFHEQRAFGELCWGAFMRYMGWTVPVPWDELKYQKSIEAFQFRRGDRSVALKKMSLNRADQDFPLTITAKTQWKAKDRGFSVAKPLQPVVIHADEYTFKHGPFGIYLLDKLMANSPHYWYFQAKRTPEEFGEWVSQHFPVDASYQMNDQKGQDQAVQGWAVYFFMQLMRWFSFPEYMIEEFQRDKMSKQIGHKILAIMTDSGEIWTYLINSLSSAARECAMYDLPAGLPMANGGDDILRATYGGLSSDYIKVRHLDPSIDKRYVSDRGDFTSFIVKRGQLFKDPIILCKRFLKKIANGEGEIAIDGYFHLWAFNYAKTDLIAELLDEDEVAAHQIMTRIMFNLRKEGIKTHVDWSLLKIDGEVKDENNAAMFYEDATKMEEYFENAGNALSNVAGSEQTRNDYREALSITAMMAY